MEHLPTEHLDVLIIGAGLSGVGAAYHVQTELPGKSFALLEGRDAIGGTWDLFRYPGIRSDSDMYTLGYAFRPWPAAAAIADGPSILAYVRDTAAAYGIDRKVRFNHRVVAAAWSSRESRWTVEVERGGERISLTCSFLFACSGYYDYDAGYLPAFPGVDSFAGRLVHPQTWPDGLDTAGKRVVVIGSGATAVTLVPALARGGAVVTMLQRSPSYVVSMPSIDALAVRLKKLLPAKLAYAAVRWRNILLGILLYKLARSRPATVKKRLKTAIRDILGPDFDVERHFSPRYDPWDQRVCLVPDSDLFVELKAGRATMMTDEVDAFTPTGLRLRSGAQLAADIVVAATGLKMKMLGGVALSVDGRRVDLARTVSYKGLMFSGVPNLAAALGYTNASWTLKCDLTCAYVCRLIRYMDRRGLSACVPDDGGGVEGRPLIDFTSGYIRRAEALLPRQGNRKPWRLHQNYVSDLLALRFGRIDDGVMRFTPRDGNGPFEPADTSGRTSPVAGAA